MFKKSYDKKVFLTAFLATFIIHGARIFNVLCWHDDSQYIFKGWNRGLGHGRWLHHIMASVIEGTSGHEILPVFSGIISALCIGLIACLIFDLFCIKDYRIQLPLILIFSAIPAVAGHFGYIGSAGYDFIGKLLCVVAAYVVCRGVAGKKGVIPFIIGAFLFACSLGEYQCYVAFYLTILLLYFIMEILNAKHSWKDYFAKALYYVGSSIAGLAIYLVILKLFLVTAGKELSSYAGTDTFGIVGISKYIERFKFSYTDFFEPRLDATYNMFPFHWEGWHTGLIYILVGLLIINIVLKIIKKGYQEVVQCFIAFALIPLAFNFNFVAYGAETTHSLHMYHYIFLFVCIYTLARAIDEQFVNINCKESIRKGVVKGIYGLTATAITLFGVLYIRYDNYCYMQAEVRQEKAISYFTTLVTRIQSIEGYDDYYEVMFINSDQKKNLVDVIEERYDPIVTNPYSYPIVNSYAWDNYLSLWIGYEPSFEYSEEYLSLDKVQEMPSYPDDGSIQIIDDIIVVKF